jgi:hypothetical protein
MGVDRLSRAATLVLIALLLAGCDSGGRPKRLLHGEAAAEFKPVSGSVLSSARVLRGVTLGRRFLLCRPESVARDALVVERIGVFSESLTFTDRHNRTLYSCDGGTDAALERRPPWCSGSAGRLFEGSLLDPRLDIGCRDPSGKPLAYAWIEPVRGAHWIGVDQGSYTEIYEVVAGLPVRIATTRHVDLARSAATFDVAQYDAGGRALVEGQLEAAVAG